MSNPLFQSLSDFIDNGIDRETLTTHITTNETNLSALLNFYGSARDDASDEQTAWRNVPVLIKANLAVKDKPLSCASKILEHYVSPFDATFVEKLRGKGAKIIGHTNMDEFGMGSTTENSAFAISKNPWDLTRTPGGSSGGSAAAVAAGYAPLAFGTDTGGSVRQPASFCGIVGLKPSYGRISRYGMVSYASGFDQVGIFSRYAKDAAVTLDAVSGFDEKDSTSMNLPSTTSTATLEQPLTGKTLGVVTGLFDKVTDTETKAVFANAIKAYEAMGMNIVEVELPDPEVCVSAYYILACCEASSNLSRYDGVRYGHRADKIEDLADLYTRSRSEGFGSEVKHRIMLGTFALSSGFFDAYYLKAQKMRRYIRNHFIDLFSDVDAVLSPTSTITAPKIGVPFDYNDDMCTITANLAGLPALSHPIGFSDGLPVGLQVTGKPFDEALILALAHQYEVAHGNPSQVPSAVELA